MCGACLSRSLPCMTTATTVTYQAMQAQADDQRRRADRSPRSTTVRSTGVSRRAALARRVWPRLRLA